MKGYFKNFLLVLLLIIILPVYGQTGQKESLNEIKMSPRAVNTFICDNGSFENGSTFGYYNVTTQSIYNTAFNCDFDVLLTGSTNYPISGVNNFNNQATLVNSNVTIAGGNDPYLNSLAIPVNVSRVKSGKYAMKLNDDTANNGVTTLAKVFLVNTSTITFSYSLIMQHAANETINNVPHFIVRLSDSNLNLIDEYCINPISNSTLFNNAGNTSGNPIKYTNWQTVTLTTGNMYTGEHSLLQFYITDCNKGDDYATVYIDDICGGCQDCISVDDDVLSSSYDQKQAETCIKVLNTVEDGAKASYHAGEEVVLYPDSESLYGSTSHFYIEACSGSYNLRESVSVEEELPLSDSVNGIKVYPNPTVGELNIFVGNEAINALRLTTLEGKTIHVSPQSDNGNYRLDMSSVSQGIYLLTIEKKNGEIVTQKIVKQ